MGGMGCTARLELPLLLILGLILSAISFILIDIPFGNTHLEKITTWYR